MDPWILKNSKKKMAKHRAHALFTREVKTLLNKGHGVCIRKAIFACKSYICVSLFVFFHVPNGVGINLEFIYFMWFYQEPHTFLIHL